MNSRDGRGGQGGQEGTGSGSGRSSYQDFINFIIEAGSKAEDIVRIPKDYPIHLRAGIEYGQLMLQPGWKRLLDDLEARADHALAALRSSDSPDANVIKHLRDQWKEAEESLKFVQ